MGGRDDVPSSDENPPGMSEVLQWSSRISWRWVFADVFDNAEVAKKRRGRPATVRWKVEGRSFGASCGSLDGLEDKDEMIVTLKSHNLEWVGPRSELVPWTVTTIENTLFAAVTSDPRTWPVLKAPCGSRGDGISLAETPKDVLDVVLADAERVRNEGPAFIDEFRRKRRNRRDPAYVLQEQISSGQRRESLRVYVLIFRGRPLIYKRVEARSAPDVDGDDLRTWFLTNGNSKPGADRRVLPELSPPVADLVSKLLKGLEPEFHERVVAVKQADDDVPFAFGALDLIFDATGRPFLLEVNSAPAAPPEEGLTPSFRSHLLNLAKDIVDTVTALDTRDGGEPPLNSWLRPAT